MMLLISAAGLTHQFRFAGNVTNLQQAAAAPKGEVIAASIFAGCSALESHGAQAAEDVSKVWRFFVTYAMVETGPLSRHVLSTRA